MVTGIETVGVVLAIIPLVVNQLDAYVQGIETVKGLRTKRYRRQLEQYSTRLGTQQVILLNTLEKSLEDIVEYDDDISELIKNPQGPLWKDPTLQAKLRKKLDRNYDAFMRTMTELSISLETLAKKLGLEAADPLKIPWDDSTGIEREIKKFKDIFSKSVYSDLLSRIDGANGALKTLMDQSRHHEESRRTRRGSNISLLKYKSIRKHAANLYNTVTQGKYWNCPCKNSHCVHLRIEPQSIGTNDDHRTNPVQFKLRMAFSSMSANKSTAPSWHWHEVETIPAVSETQDAPSKFPSTVTAVPRPTAPRKVQFAIVTSSLQSLPWPEVQDLPPALSISDMCLALRSVNTTSKPKEYIGTISDGADTTRRYNFYLVGKIDGGVETQSLEDLLSSSSSSIIIPAGHGNRTLSRRDRLFLAATLASSVLQFHGTWLKSQWDSRDILFAKSQIGSKTVVEHLYLSGHKVHMPQESTRFPKTTEATKSLIRSQALFPLGITLVELSLGQPISALWVPENNEPVNAVTSYIIGSQQLDSLLDNVYGESGGHYGDVVKKCLYWSDTRNVGFEDDGFQRIFFNTVVLPLVEDLRTFEGNARHY